MSAQPEKGHGEDATEARPNFDYVTYWADQVFVMLNQGTNENNRAAVREIAQNVHNVMAQANQIIDVYGPESLRRLMLQINMQVYHFNEQIRESTNTRKNFDVAHTRKDVSAKAYRTQNNKRRRDDYFVSELVGCEWGDRTVLLDRIDREMLSELAAKAPTVPRKKTKKRHPTHLDQLTSPHLDYFRLWHAQRKSHWCGIRRRRNILRAQTSRQLTSFRAVRSFSPHIEEILNATTKTDVQEKTRKKKRRKRCGRCPGCVRPNCGECVMCLDKPEYGGSFRKKQACLLRVCSDVGVSESKAIDPNEPTGNVVKNKTCPRRRGSVALIRSGSVFPKRPGEPTESKGGPQWNFFRHCGGVTFMRDLALLVTAFLRSQSDSGLYDDAPGTISWNWVSKRMIKQADDAKWSPSFCRSAWQFMSLHSGMPLDHGD